MDVFLLNIFCLKSNLRPRNRPRKSSILFHENSERRKSLTYTVACLKLLSTVTFSKSRGVPTIIFPWRQINTTDTTTTMQDTSAVLDVTQERSRSMITSWFAYIIDFGRGCVTKVSLTIGLRIHHVSKYMLWTFNMILEGKNNTLYNIGYDVVHTMCTWCIWQCDL